MFFLLELYLLNHIVGTRGYNSLYYYGNTVRDNNDRWATIQSWYNARAK